KNVFGAFFGTLLKSLGSGISALGKQMLLAAIAIQIAKKSLGKLTGVGAAIALIAVGALIQFASSKIQQATFASGVRSFGGGYALVGERGPE
ncbi:hypothetical protein, partial [Escherichia coli]|uniref:hypothetical protein n=1 Tax=Escherichia coli TaxID=562 RepID=UPI001F4815CC